MVYSRVTGRTHHYLSGQEFSTHLLAEYSKNILDIREQYALLPWDTTQEIASKLGIRHPIFPGTHSPIVMTTDLFLTLQEPDGKRHIAVSVKPSKSLTARTFEKLLLERLYWNKLGITWILATEQNIPQVRVHNLRFFECSSRNNEVRRSGVDPALFALDFEQRWRPDQTYIEILRSSCLHFDLDTNLGHSILGTAVWRRQSQIDLDHSKLAHTALVKLTNTKIVVGR